MTNRILTYSSVVYIASFACSVLAQQTTAPLASPSVQPRQVPTESVAPVVPGQTQQVPSPPQATAPLPAAVPNVARFGNNQFANLTPSSYYASPLAVSLGAGSNRDSSALSSYFGSAAHRNLLDVPEMFGDRRRAGSSILFNPTSTAGSTPRGNPLPESGDFPFGGTFSGMRASENNVSLPQDRVWMSYHHYHNGFALQSGDLSLDRFVLGLEKTFDGGAASLEIRLPIAGSLDPNDPLGFTAFAGGSFGNLQILAKRVLIAADDRVLAAGLLVEAPTGSAWHASDTSAGNAEFTLDPSAVYLSPYLATLRTFNETWFLNAFAQVEIATHGDKFTASTSINANSNGRQEYAINQPTTLMLDLGGGVWLSKPCRHRCGVALISEIHVASALTGVDSLVISPAAFPSIAVDTTPIRNLVNVTNGVHLQWNSCWSLRTAISTPLLEDRIFDTELMLQINRNY